MKNSYFLNWHKPSQWFRAKRKPLSRLMVNRGNVHPGIQIQFGDEFGTQIQFELNDEDTKLLLMHLDRVIKGKDVKREDYGLLPL